MYRISLIVIVIATLSSGLPASASESDPPRTVLVTGASSGIGLTITQILADRGFYVYAGARKESDLERLDAMPGVSSVRLDVTKQDEIDAAVEFIESRDRGLYGVVNNAGVAAVGLLGTVPDADIMWMHDVNVMGPLRVNRAFLPMLTKSHGRTLIIGSGSGFVTNDSGGGYSMSKFAVEAYTDTLASELAKTGVTVGIVDPGAFRSRGREKAVMHMLTGVPDLDQELTGEQSAILESVREANAKLQEPDAVAEAVFHFLDSESPRSRYMVVPDETTAHMVIRATLRRAVQLNADQPFEMNRDQLVELLDRLLGELN